MSANQAARALADALIEHVRLDSHVVYMHNEKGEDDETLCAIEA